jgi:hypothetical protein
VIFKCTLTRRATEKDSYDVLEVDAERFIQNLQKRGHTVGEKDGSGIITALFQPGSRLEQRNVVEVTGLILDIDGKFREGKGVRYEAVEPEWLLQLLPYRGVAHTSYNHSPALPKYRVILPLARPVTPAQYQRLWHWIYEKTDRKCDPQCKNPDRMFFLPRCSQEALDAGWHWIQETRGPLLDLSMVPADFQPSSTSPTEGPRRRQQGAHRAPPCVQYPSVDAEKLVDALLALPLYQWARENPLALNREVWRGLATNIAAAVLDDTAAHDLGSDAFHLISKPDEERYNYGDCERVFRDALKSARDYGPMTYATLALNGAPLSDTDAKSPIAEARRRLKDTPPSPKEEPPPGEAPTGSTGGGDEKSDDGFEHTPEDFLFDVHNGWMIRFSTGEWSEPIKDAAFNTLLVQLGLPDKAVKAFRSHIRHFHKREPLYDTADELVTRDGVTIFNTYVRPTLVPKAGNWDDIRSLFLNLAGDDVDALEYILDWLAVPLQSLRNQGRPYKMGTALVFLGEQGSGKGTAAHIIAQMYGDENFTTFGQETLDGRFNGMLIDKLFVVANEVMSSSNRSAETANKVKPWITDTEIAIERKYSEPRLVANNFNIVFTSNDDRPVLLEKADRRYSVFRSNAIDRNLVARIYADLLNKKTAVAAFYDHLLARKARVHYGELFGTAAREQLIAASAPSDVKFVLELVKDGWYAVSRAWVDNAPSNKIRLAVEADMVPAATLLEVYRDYCKWHGVRQRSVQSLIASLREHLPGVTQEMPRIGGVRVRAWSGIPLHGEDGNVIPFGPPATVSVQKIVSDAGDFG